MPEDNHANNRVSRFQDTYQSRALLTNMGLKISWIYLYRAFGRLWFSDVDYIYCDSVSNSVTNLVGLAFKCLIIIIGQRLFSSLHKFCLISATAHRWNLWKEGMQQSIINHVPKRRVRILASIRPHQVKRTYSRWVAMSICTSGGARAGDSTKCRFTSLHVADSSMR